MQCIFIFLSFTHWYINPFFSVFFTGGKMSAEWLKRYLVYLRLTKKSEDFSGVYACVCYVSIFVWVCKCACMRVCVCVCVPLAHWLYLAKKKYRDHKLMLNIIFFDVAYYIILNSKGFETQFISHLFFRYYLYQHTVMPYFWYFSFDDLSLPSLSFIS